MNENFDENSADFRRAFNGVLAGKYGTGQGRKAALDAEFGHGAGDAVQKFINSSKRTKPFEIAPAPKAGAAPEAGAAPKAGAEKPTEPPKAVKAEAAKIAEEVKTDPGKAESKYKDAPFIGGAISAYKNGLFGDKNSSGAKMTLAHYLLDGISTAFFNAAGIGKTSEWQSVQGRLNETAANRYEDRTKVEQVGKFSGEEKSAAIAAGQISDRGAQLQGQIDSLVSQKAEIGQRIADLEKAKAETKTDLIVKQVQAVGALLGAAVGSTSEGSNISRGKSSSFGASANMDTKAGAEGGIGKGGKRIGLDSAVGMGGGLSYNSSKSLSVGATDSASRQIFAPEIMNKVSRLLGEIDGEGYSKVEQDENGQAFYAIDPARVPDSEISNYNLFNKKRGIFGGKPKQKGESGATFESSDEKERAIGAAQIVVLNKFANLLPKGQREKLLKDKGVGDAVAAFKKNPELQKAFAQEWAMASKGLVASPQLAVKIIPENAVVEKNAEGIKSRIDQLIQTLREAQTRLTERIAELRNELASWNGAKKFRGVKPVLSYSAGAGGGGNDGEV